MVWSDPIENPDGKMKNLSKFNKERNCSIYYGKALADTFLRENSLKFMIRAHEVVPQGYRYSMWG